jgi:sulfoxide reductase heme-binding subunit YedZ
VTGSLLILFSLALSGSALVVGLLAAALILVVAPKEATTSPAAWATSALGVLGLVAANAGGSVRFLDLATVAGVVLVGGVAGAGWAPPGRRTLLALGLLCLGTGLFAHLDAFSHVLGSVDGLSWGIARSSGFVAFLAATGAVVLGARRPSGLPIGGLPARVYALHRALGIAALLAMAVHLAALWTDDFVEFSWGQLLLWPWTSEYKPFAVTLGWAAMLALPLTSASGGLRRFLPGWRLVHALACLTFALSLAHGLLSGSDSGSPYVLAFYAATLLVVAYALLSRLPRSGPRFTRRGRKKRTARDVSVPPGAAARENGSVLMQPVVGSGDRARHQVKRTVKND